MIEKKEKIHILLCDPDKEKNRELTAVLKEVARCTVDEVPVFSEIPDKVKTRVPEMIIIGDRFPDVTPVEILKYLKIEPDLKALPVLLHATGENAELTKELISEGLTAVIPAPADVPVVRRALRNYYRRLTSQEISRKVQQAKFFENFTPEELKKLASIAIPRKYKVGETVIQKGEPADTFYILLQGRIETMVVDSTQRPMNIEVSEGSCFGEMAILDNSPRSAFCIAADDSIVLEIGSHIINDTNDTLRLKIFATLALVLVERLRNMNKVTHDLQMQLAQYPTMAPETEIDEEELKASDLDGPDAEVNPFAEPTGTADEIDSIVDSQEEYDVLKRKINLRTDFIVAKIPNAVEEMICNKLFGYWTGGKLAKFNPHIRWSPKSFTTGTCRLKRALHMVVVHSKGQSAYYDGFLGLPFSHRVIGATDVGCCGTFLSSEDAITRYLADENLPKAIQFDFEIAIDRLWKRKECIEYLTHTAADVRNQTLFLIFDKEDGKNTRRFRERFPEHQMVTVVSGTDFDFEEPSTLFTQPEAILKEKEAIVQKKDYKGTGFYTGQTFFLPDFSMFYKNTDKLLNIGHVFGTIGMLAQVGPDYSGITWGSKGGAEGAVRASRALFGLKGAQSAEDLASAISWADN